MKKKRGEKKKKRKKKEEPRKVWKLCFYMESMELVRKCYDFVWKLLGYGLLGFSMDFWVIDLVP